MVPDASQAFFQQKKTLSPSLRTSDPVIHPVDLNSEAKMAEYSAADMVSGHLDPYSQHL
ncbi:hypothetical protein MKW92_009514, partial [Papaver armeniacum]